MASLLPFADRLHPDDAEMLFHDIPLRLVDSLVFSNNHQAGSSTISPVDTVAAYLYAVLAHLPDLVTPGRELLSLCYTLRRAVHVRDVLRRVSALQEEIIHRIDLIDILERVAGRCMILAELAMAMQTMGAGLSEIGRLFAERLVRARRAVAGTGREGRRRDRHQARNGRAAARGRSGDHELMVGVDGNTGGPLSENIVRTMVQLLCVESLLVLTWHELVAVLDA